MLEPNELMVHYECSMNKSLTQEILRYQNELYGKIVQLTITCILHRKHDQYC